MKKLNRPISFLTLVFILACGHTPPPAPLTMARDHFSRAQLHRASELAPDEYLAAKKALEEAELAFKDNEQDETIMNRSAVAQSRSEIALLAAQEALNKKRINDIELVKMDILKRRKEAAELLRAQHELLTLKDRELSEKDEALRKLQQDRDRMRKSLEEATAEIAKVRETKRGLIVSLSNIIFDFDKADLKAGAQKNLAKVASLLKEYPDRMISIEGHTDGVGSDQYNLKLSQFRAASVYEFLRSQGMPDPLLKTKGYGEKYPLASNQTAEGRQQNRRVDIVILNPDQNQSDPSVDFEKKG